MIKKIIIIVLLISANIIPQSGKYFYKKKYDNKPLPKWEIAKNKLPKPVLEDDKKLLELYWKSWEIAFRGLKQPAKGSPLVSNWIDEAFSENIFQWDTIFMIMFARYAHHIFPAIESLDNFYHLQYENGFIGREFRESDGKLIHFDFDGGLFSDKGWKNMINPPLFSWAELESFKISNDTLRLKRVLPVLEKYAEWLDKPGDPEAANWKESGRKSISKVHNLYWNTPLGCGMDNTPRPADLGAGWVEMSSQMALMYENLGKISHILGNFVKEKKYLHKASLIKTEVNKWCWNESEGFYFDVDLDGKQFKKKTIGGFWPLIAGIPSVHQAKKLISHLFNKNEFYRLIPFATISADEKEFNPKGGYWLGGVWAPTNVAIIKGLEKYGFTNEAYNATYDYLKGMFEVYKTTNTIWENYSPDYYLPGEPARPDFVGWSGCGPIQLLIENIIGISVDSQNSKIKWNIKRKDKHGIENLFVNGNLITLIISKVNNNYREISLKASSKLKLEINYEGKTYLYTVNKGKQTIKLRKG